MSASNGNILLNSEEISSTVSIVNDVVSTLENDMSSSINSNFNTLLDLGLFSEGIENIKKQISSLATAYKAVAVEIASHISEFEEVEDTLSNGISNYINSNSNNTENNSSNNNFSSNNENIIVSDIQEGTTINDQTLLNSIAAINDETKNKLIEFLSVNKDNNITISELMFNTANTTALVTLLKKFYGDSNPTISNIENATIIQKTLINKLFASNDIPSSISENTILVAKKYLNIIAKNNNITVGDLLLDDDKSNLLSSALMNVYDGNGLSEFGLTENEIKQIREYMDKVAISNNSAVEELITNPKKFL